MLALTTENLKTLAFVIEHNSSAAISTHGQKTH